MRPAAGPAGPAALPDDQATVQRSAGEAPTAITPSAPASSVLPDLTLDFAAGIGSIRPPAGTPALPTRTVQTSGRDAPAMTLARPTVAASSPVPATTTINFPAAAGGLRGSTMGGSLGQGSVGPTVQTASAGGAGPTGSTSATVVQRIDGSAPSLVPATETQSEGDLEELAKALFPRFQRQLRMQYVHEREARGLPFDI
jgi:hypothetical protein